MFWLVTRDNENLIKFRVKQINKNLFYIKLTLKKYYM